MKIRKQILSLKYTITISSENEEHFFFILPLDEQFVHLLVSLPGFRRQKFVADDSVRLCV